MHERADAALTELGARMLAALRSGDTVARYSADEFVILCDPIAGPGAAHEIAERVLGSLVQPVSVDGREMALSASVGVALSWGARTTSRALLHAADTSLYRAKRAGKGRAELAPAHKRGA